MLSCDKKIYVDDTLILHCQIAGYQKLIPYIFGPYKRLVLHGRITWSQAKQLIHDGVEQVRINAIIQMEPMDYDDFVDFVIRHCRGSEYKFSFLNKRYYNFQLMTKLYNAYRNHETYCVLNNGYDSSTFHVVHKSSPGHHADYTATLFFYHFVFTSIIYFLLLLISGELTYLVYYKQMRESVFLDVCVTPLMFLLFFHGWMLTFGPTVITPMDIISDRQ
uniref:7TM_GPCR_Srx domain-containing protein n=1 Tax=Panagrellus redivivus TaxID=6233 RepID=A0A7E4ZX14_PANRE